MCYFNLLVLLSLYSDGDGDEDGTVDAKPRCTPTFGKAVAIGEGNLSVFSSLVMMQDLVIGY